MVELAKDKNKKPSISRKVGNHIKNYQRHRLGRAYSEPGQGKSCLVSKFVPS